MANVNRALHSVSTVAGPADGPGRQDVLFNNRTCAVAGIVDRILEKVKPVASYPRIGNLYVAKMKMRSFGRQGASS